MSFEKGMIVKIRICDVKCESHFFDIYVDKLSEKEIMSRIGIKEIVIRKDGGEHHATLGCKE